MSELKQAHSLKHLPIEFDAKAVKDDGTFEGYASTFGNVDSGYDVVMPGAFAKSLVARPAPRIKMLWQHDRTQPIGVWSEAAEDSKGLFVKGALLRDVQRGAEAYALMKAGVIDSMSIGYKTLEADFTQSGVRQLKEVGLFEVSLVTFAMNDQAVVTTVKEFNPREWERGLRDAGLSRGDAVKAVAFFRERLREAGENVAIDPREAEAAALSTDVVDAMRKLQAAFR
ncbi:HK97 family phage prohead protease [Methylosinus sp. Ce-a6]|uniref:HK97 family phage prohead protease n=1 Tax=Methylosinus sp. Ce-a6 TaxID=2172005 RepID=UPI0013569BDD|nr:HK97 family phage prohead protease [Methylosinus sp. Ce-a6]